MAQTSTFQLERHHRASEGIEIDLAYRRVQLKGQPLAVAGRAFELLAALAEKSGTHVSTDALTSSIWRGRVVEPHNLRVQVNRLRQLLGADAISNLPGHGYRLELPVRHGAKPGTRWPVGRDRERAELDTQARANRLLTVTGAGGIGKTHLVRAWFDELNVGTSLGAAWVDLTGASASELPTLAAKAFGLADTSVTWTIGALAAALPTRNRWLVIDTAEHLAEAVAAAALALLQAAPQLHIVVTSQLPLRVTQEKVLHLGPLQLPEVGATLEQALQTASIELLNAQLCTLDPGHVLDEAKLADAITLCRSLDGLPLAIELAAARIPVLGLPKLVDSLDQRLQLLHSPTHDRPPRQQTLRAALEWTRSLLHHSVQTVFARLGVFTGAFTLETAVAVVTDPCGCPPIDRLAVIDALQALVDASLVTRCDAKSGTPHYRLLESPRLFAMQCLHEADQQDITRQRHLAWYLGWVDRAPVADLRSEQAPLLAALDWALSGGDLVGGAHLAKRLLAHPGLVALQEAAPAGSATRADPDDAVLARLLNRIQRAGVQVPAKPAGLDGEAPMPPALRVRPAAVRKLDGTVHGLDRASPLTRSATRRQMPVEALDDFVRSVLAEVAEHTRHARFDEGGDLVDEAVAELERGEARHRAAHQESMRRLLDSGVQLDLLRRDGFAVARRTAALLALDSIEHPTHLDDWRQREEQALALGQTGNDTLWLEVAAELARRRLAEAGSAEERGSARRVLACALVSLGDRDKATDALQQATQTCRDALAETSHQQDPALWGALQHELASALGLLGAQASDSAMLQEALQACDAALRVRTRASAPQDWAATQQVRGLALHSLGLIEAGTLHLERAAQVLGDALLELTPGRAPLARARTLTTLGMTLSAWAERENRPQRHWEALGLHQAAPALWAQVCHHIGDEHDFLGSTGEQP